MSRVGAPVMCVWIEEVVAMGAKEVWSYLVLRVLDDEKVKEHIVIPVYCNS